MPLTLRSGADFGAGAVGTESNKESFRSEDGDGSEISSTGEEWQDAKSDGDLLDDSSVARSHERDQREGLGSESGDETDASESARSRQSGDESGQNRGGKTGLAAKLNKFFSAIAEQLGTTEDLVRQLIDLAQAGHEEAHSPDERVVAWSWLTSVHNVGVQIVKDHPLATTSVLGWYDYFLLGLYVLSVRQEPLVLAQIVSDQAGGQQIQKFKFAEAFESFGKNFSSILHNTFQATYDDISHDASLQPSSFIPAAIATPDDAGASALPLGDAFSESTGDAVGSTPNTLPIVNAALILSASGILTGGTVAAAAGGAALSGGFAGGAAGSTIATATGGAMLALPGIAGAASAAIAAAPAAAAAAAAAAPAAAAAVLAPAAAAAAAAAAAPAAAAAAPAAAAAAAAAAVVAAPAAAAAVAAAGSTATQTAITTAAFWGGQLIASTAASQMTTTLLTVTGILGLAVLVKTAFEMAMGRPVSHTFKEFQSGVTITELKPDAILSAKKDDKQLLLQLHSKLHKIVYGQSPKTLLIVPDDAQIDPGEVNKLQLALQRLLKQEPENITTN
jgi:hypothetical protein